MQPGKKPTPRRAREDALIRQHEEQYLFDLTDSRRTKLAKISASLSRKGEQSPPLYELFADLKKRKAKEGDARNAEMLRFPSGGHILASYEELNANFQRVMQQKGRALTARELVRAEIERLKKFGSGDPIAAINNVYHYLSVGGKIYPVISTEIQHKTKQLEQLLADGRFQIKAKNRPNLQPRALAYIDLGYAAANIMEIEFHLALESFMKITQMKVGDTIPVDILNGTFGRAAVSAKEIFRQMKKINGK